MIYDYFRVTGRHDSVENYADLFTISLRNDDIQEFDSKWDGILLSMTKIPHDDILEGLYKLRIRESEKLSENIRVKHAHDGTQQPVEQNSSSVHTVKEQFAPEENRDIASFNTDNEFNRAINEENIDFSENPQRHALQSDLQQHRQFNPFSKESRDVIKAAGKTKAAIVSSVTQDSERP